MLANFTNPQWKLTAGTCQGMWLGSSDFRLAIPLFFQSMIPVEGVSCHVSSK